MITEQYVSFKTAKLAKEKGFNESCLFVYIDNKLQQIPCEYKPKSNNGYLRNSELNIYTNAISAPTQALLARWLREVHDISVAAYRTWAMDNSYNYEILVGTDFEKMIREECECDRTYEEAMEAGLQEALNLLT